MDKWLQKKYIRLLSAYLQRFRIRQEQPVMVVNFRCPICGDSKQNQNKARGYILEKERFKFMCHNCGANMRFDRFLKLIAPTLHQEYVMENITQRKQDEIEWQDEKENKVEQQTLQHKLDYAFTLLDKVTTNKVAAKYLKDRKVLEKYHDDIWYVDNFPKWVNENLIPEKFKTEHQEPRMIFPLRSESKVLNGFQGRSLDKDIASQYRYMTIKLRSDDAKIWGLDKIDKSKTCIVTEGIFDAFVLQNSIAMLGSSLTYLDDLGFDPENTIFVYDNEPRNKEIQKAKTSIVMSGWKLFIWPNFMSDCKDLNDAAVKKKARNLDQLVIENSYSGLQAMIELAKS